MGAPPRLRPRRVPCLRDQRPVERQSAQRQACRCRRRRRLLPDGLHVQRFGIRFAHRRIAGGAGSHRAGAVQQFQFQRLLRDGTLMEEVKYCCDPADVHVYPGVTDALRKLKAAGFAAIVSTNQAGIGRGYISPRRSISPCRRSFCGRWAKA